MAAVLNLILAISWLPLIYAQSDSQSSSTETPTSTSSSAANAVHTVDVGEHGLSFDPDTLSVSPGSKVEFHFYPSIHSVTQAAFSNPCHPLNQSSFFSGFITATDGESVGPSAKSKFLRNSSILILCLQSPRSSH